MEHLRKNLKARQNDTRMRRENTEELEFGVGKKQWARSVKCRPSGQIDPKAVARPPGLVPRLRGGTDEENQLSKHSGKGRGPAAGQDEPGPGGKRPVDRRRCHIGQNGDDEKPGAASGFFRTGGGGSHAIARDRKHGGRSGPADDGIGRIRDSRCGNIGGKEPEDGFAECRVRLHDKES